MLRRTFLLSLAGALAEAEAATTVDRDGMKPERSEVQQIHVGAGIHHKGRAVFGSGTDGRAVNRFRSSSPRSIV
ncbi:MAG TPA: hypothetical protein VG672_29495 [Bryobacteraceae bacterium]|nr:hypothetical protein [Bryobacteraceae bacterium]